MGELGEGGKGSCYLKPFGYWWQGPLLQQDQGVRLSTAFEKGAGTLNTFSVLSLGLRASVLALSKTTGSACLWRLAFRVIYNSGYIQLVFIQLILCLSSTITEVAAFTLVAEPPKGGIRDRDVISYQKQGARAVSNQLSSLVPTLCDPVH